MDIRVVKPKDEELKERNVEAWPIWEKEVSRFDWHYDATEECFILEGVSTASGT
jgi:uncharacterized cupin superfamily protein